MIEQEALGKQFVEEAQKLIWDYGTVKYKWYDRNYCYSYIEPGTISTPAVTIPDVKGLVSVKGDFETDKTPNIHPDSVVARRLSLCVNQEGQLSEPFIIERDTKRDWQMNQLPPVEELQGWVQRLDLIRKAYTRQGLEPNSDGFSYSCGDSRSVRHALHM